MAATTDRRESHTRLILERYADRENISVHRIDRDRLIGRYLSKAMDPVEIRGRTILELGAGCSSYVSVFLEKGCRNYYANDIIPERLAAVRVDNPRYHEIPGDFRKIKMPDDVDMIFANLTMMFIVPMLAEFVDKIAATLPSGGHFLSMDANYFCPLSVYRRFADSRANPARLFSPFAYANLFRRHGFEVQRLVPFTGAYPSTAGNWLLGTTFWLRARKK